MERYEQVKASRKTIFVNNFIGGISWALGATIGISIIIGIVSLILKHIDVIPYVGNFVFNVINFIIAKNPNLFGKL